MKSEDMACRAALALENARLYRLAEAAVRAREEFLATVSHDLKGPLAHIRARADLLRARVARLNASESGGLAEGVAQIHVATARMTRMLNELQDLSQLQAGRPLDLVRQPTDLVDLVEELIEEYRLISRRHRLSVEATVPAMVGVWDGFRIERVLSNLLSNAIKFSGTEGEVVVAVGREEEPGGEWAVVQVRDNGIGIPAADLDAVFEPFRRASNTRGRIGGTGLGLGGSRRIVEQHGGRLELTSREGEGTTVTVRLPIGAGSEHVDQPSAPR
jgi:signal transduction histidine kinase